MSFPYMNAILSGRLVSAYERDDEWEIHVFNVERPGPDDKYDIHTVSKDLGCGDALRVADEAYPVHE